MSRQIYRSVVGQFGDGFGLHDIANTAYEYSKYGLDDYSNYGVGACMVVRYKGGYKWIEDERINAYALYAAHNINISGMQVKMHAEQLVLYQFLLDLVQVTSGHPPSIEKMAIRTTDDDGAVCCGHCLQVLRSVCRKIEQYVDEVDVTAVTYEGMNDDMEKKFGYENYDVSELLAETYAEE